MWVSIVVLTDLHSDRTALDFLHVGGWGQCDQFYSLSCEWKQHVLVTANIVPKYSFISDIEISSICNCGCPISIFVFEEKIPVLLLNPCWTYSRSIKCAFVVLGLWNFEVIPTAWCSICWLNNDTSDIISVILKNSLNLLNFKPIIWKLTLT